MRKVKGWVFTIIVVIVGVLGIVAYLDFSGRGKLDRALTEARTAGVPLTPADLRANPPSASENAAPALRKAIDAVAHVKPSDKLLVDTYPTAILTPNPAEALSRAGIVGKVDRNRIATALKSWKPVFDEIGRASPKSKLDWNRQWEKGMALVFAEFAELREIEKALMVDALAAAWERDNTRLQLRMRQSKHLAELVGQEPTYLAALVSVAMQIIVSTTGAQIAIENRNDPTVVERVRRALEEPAVLPDLRVAMGGEVVFSRDAIEMIAKEPMSIKQFMSGASTGMQDQFLADAKWLKLPWVRSEVEASLIDKYVAGIKALPADSTDFLAVEKATATMAAEFAKTSTRPDRIASNFAPNLDQIGQAVTNVEVMRRLAVMTTLVLDAKRASGRWPSTLPKRREFDTDPYSGGPLRYRTQGDGFVIYSVGPDRKDDGGDVTSSKRLDRCMGFLGGRFVRR